MTEVKRIITNNATETLELGMEIGKNAKPGEVYALLGDLGVGKTVLIQGVAKGLGITGPVNSPTFTIVQVYEEGRMPFYHFDVYRIEEPEELEEIGYEEYFYGSGICLIEWADRIRELLPEDTVRVRIHKVPERGADVRCIEITGIPEELILEKK